MALTDEQIIACWERACYGLGKYEKFARAIESAACAERDARIANIERALEKAERTLTAAGYTDEGGDLWKPPLRPSVSPLLDRFAELAHQLHEQAVSLSEAHKDAERLDYIQKNARNDPKMDGNHIWWPTTLNSALKGSTLRQAIDNAMKEQT